MHENKILNPTKNLCWMNGREMYHHGMKRKNDKKLSHGNSNGICYLPATLETGNLIDIQPILVPCIASMKYIHYSRYLNG